MDRKYSSNPVERYLEVANHAFLPPRTQILTCYAIAFHMTQEERDRAKEALLEKYAERAIHLEEIGAPEVIVETAARFTDSRTNRFLQILDKASEPRDPYHKNWATRLGIEKDLEDYNLPLRDAIKLQHLVRALDKNQKPEIEGR